MTHAVASRVRKPRLGFLGLGWIGQHRMKALLDADACEVAAFVDPAADVQQRVLEFAPGAQLASSLDELLQHDLDGAVIATPSALHAQQALALLERGVAVFCQKPLARTAPETRAIVDAARRADRLLGCDFSYRHTEAMRRVRNCVVEGDLGKVYAVDLVFHNAYGPDKSWFRDPQLAGGGCAIDLGTHLIDLALWVLGPARVSNVTSRLYSRGRPLVDAATEVEDYAVAQFELSTGAVVRLVCSWNLHAGCDCVIEASFHGERAGAALRNVNGSFYDFTAERNEGTRRTLLASPPDAWGGRAIVDWAKRLSAGSGYSASIESAVAVATVLDAIYGR
jgi:predicted dehydrogenase